MKRTLSVILTIIISLGLFTGCKVEIVDAISSVTTSEKEGYSYNVISPLPETLDVDSLSNCTVAVSLEKGDFYVDDNGKAVMKVKVYVYDLYDMVDIALLKENDIIVRRNEEIKVTEFERLDTGLIRINGGEEAGGFDLISDDSTVYYEIGMNNAKVYYELGEVTLPVSNGFEYVDKSAHDAEVEHYYSEDFLIEDADVEYNFSPKNTSIVIENGFVTKMNKVYMP